MIDQACKSKMISSDEKIKKTRDSSQISNDTTVSEALISSEQKLLIEQNNPIKNVNTIQKVDTGRNINGYRFVKVLFRSYRMHVINSEG